MKKYTMSFADSLTHMPKFPERTAKRSGTGMNFDVTYQVWTNRESMAHSIRMQQRGDSYLPKWTACVPLRETEGY